MAVAQGEGHQAVAVLQVMAAVVEDGAVTAVNWVAAEVAAQRGKEGQEVEEEEVPREACWVAEPMEQAGVPKEGPAVVTTGAGATAKEF